MHEEIDRLLKQGVPRAEIARYLGIGASTVTRHAHRLGYAGRERPHLYDWPAIRSFYEDGHSLAECRERFGFSNGAWDAAVGRGDVRPRPSHRRARARARRDAVAALCREGLSGAEIARRLGVTAPTVAHHLRALGQRPDTRFARRFDWTSISDAHDAGSSLGELQVHFGFSSASWYQAIVRGDVRPRPAGMPISELLSGPRSRTHVKGRLLRAGLKESRCEDCGLETWRGRPLALQLHHLNGDGRDNRSRP